MHYTVSPHQNYTYISIYIDMYMYTHTYISIYISILRFQNNSLVLNLLNSRNIYGLLKIDFFNFRHVIVELEKKVQTMLLKLEN